MPHASHDMTCVICKKTKPASLFYAKHRKASSPVCKACSIARVSLMNAKKKGLKLKSRFISNSKYGLPVKRTKTPADCIANKKYNERRKKHKEAIFQLFGNKCKMCGEKDQIVLQVDHVNGGGTKERKKTNSLRRYRMVLENPSKYQLLCANCNVRKKYFNKET